MAYIWLKAAHVAAVFVFVGGLLVQSLAVTLARDGGVGFLARVRAWDRRVTSPALLAVWILGVLLAVQGGWFGMGWLTAKLVLVVALTGLHGIQAGALRRLGAGGRTSKPSLLDRTPTAVALSVATIALLAVAKPF